MSGSLRDLVLEEVYRSSTHRIGRDFYARLLGQATQYRRAAGFFSSSVFGVATEAHLNYLKRGGRIELICSDMVSPIDAAAFGRGVYERPKTRRAWSLEDLGPDQIGEAPTLPDFVAWLIASDRLLVRVARLVGSAHTNIYHEKIGIFYDIDGNLVAFGGSANETEHGYVSNFERVDTFASFGTPTDRRRAFAIERHFLELWNGETPGIETLSLQDALERGIFRPPVESDLAPRPKGTPEPPPPPIIVGEPEALCPPVWLQLHRHQDEAIRAWAAAGGRGILEMATGSGKTITALSLASRLYDASGGPLVILIIAPLIHLVDQWIEVASAFGLRPVRCAEGASRWSSELAVGIQAANGATRNVLSVVTTTATMGTDTFQRAFASVRTKLLVIADEAHACGARSTARALPSQESYRLGLSATPDRWMDPEGSHRLRDYFGDVVYQYSLADALRDEVLAPYRYYPQLIHFDPEEMDEYIELTRRIGRLVGRDEDATSMSEQAKSLLIRRARLVASASAKLPLLRDLLRSRTRDTHILVYCGDGTVDSPDGEETVRQVEEAVRVVGAELGMVCASYTARTSPERRRELLADFADGSIQVLVAIRCLDEGVDVPATRTAFILASSTNPRQFVQRRGRVLRRFPGKDRADIYDFFVVPDPSRYPRDDPHYRAARSLLRGQLARSREFIELAENGPVAGAKLRPFRDHFDLLGEG